MKVFNERVTEENACELWHRLNNVKFVKNGINKVRDIIVFCDAGVTKDLDKKLFVGFPPKHINADIATNLFMFWKPNYLYENKQQFIEAIKIFIPSENIEEKGGFLNISFTKQSLLDNLYLIK